MQIENHRLYHDDGTPYPFVESPNVSERLINPMYIIFHYTGGPNAEAVIRLLTNPESKVSAHAIIDRDGSITQLVSFAMMAWHAGTSEWQGKQNLNQYSIGIELVNEGVLEQKKEGWISNSGTIYPDSEVLVAQHAKDIRSRGWVKYSSQQLETAQELARSLVEHYGLMDVLGHDDIQQNKLDPGPAFPIEDIRKGIYDRKNPLFIEVDSDQTEKPSSTESQVPGDEIPTPPAPDSMVFQSDSPASEDRLGRRGFAIALGTWLSNYWEEFNKTGSQSFAVHIQGQWGAGKTTLLNLLQEELQKNRTSKSDNQEPTREQGSWIVVWFNAWQHQHIEPVWWPLMDKIYRQSIEQLGDTYKEPKLARQISNWERIWRFRTGNNFYLLALAGSLLVLFVLLLLPIQTGIPEDSNYIGVIGGTAKAVTQVIALLISVWSGVRFFTHSYFFGSSSSAELFLKLAPDPLDQIKRHFDELIEKVNHPMIVYIDDLDRCNTDHVVKLVESIQTLFSHPRVFYAVASDRRWLYVCFEKVYEDFLEQINEPGRRLGYLFLEKFFQLSVSIPEIPEKRRKAFFDYLLKVKEPEEQLEAMWEAARKEFEEAKTQEALIEKISSSTGDEVRDQIRAEAAVAQSASQDIVISDKHFLQQFEHLLEPNPRAMKRLVNAYGVYRALALQSNLKIITEELNRKKLALWTIVSLRWPMLAEYLEENPADVMKIRDREPLFEQQKNPELRSLERNEQLISVLNGEGIGVVLDRESILLLLGIKVSRKTPTIVA